LQRHERIVSNPNLDARFFLALSSCQPHWQPLSSSPYAETDRAQQNEEGRGQTIQNHGHGKSFALAIFASPFDVVEKRETETAAGEKRSGRQHRYRADQGELAVRLSIRPRSHLAPF
jgi:hypothetical protein